MPVLAGPPTGGQAAAMLVCPAHLEQANRGVVERRHRMGDVATAHLRAVFIERHIADPMRLILEGLPMASHEIEQPLGVARWDADW